MLTKVLRIVPFRIRSFVTDAIIQKICWKCGNKTQCCTFNCESCKSIQPVAERKECNYFHYFNIPEKFNINIKYLEKKFWNLQKKMHPDTYQLATKKEKDYSALNSSAINLAYKILKEPTARSNYLLQLHHMNAIDENLKAYIDPERLGEILDLREKIAETNDKQTLENIFKKNEIEIQKYTNDLEMAYDNDRNLEKTKDLTVQLQYLQKIKAELKEKMDV